MSVIKALASLIALFTIQGCAADSSARDYMGGDDGAGGVGGDGESGQNAGGAGGGNEGGGSPAPTFDPDNPGVRLSLMIGEVAMMGQLTCLAAGAAEMTAREDFDPAQEREVPLETCEETNTTRTPRCSSKADCAPEQDCLPEKDKDGKPIPSSERCVTARSPIDIGPYALSGFTSGTKNMVYNSGQSGAYTIFGKDGTVDCPDLGHDVTYALSGQGSTQYGVGAFTGSIRLGAAWRLTQPSESTSSMGLTVINVRANEDLVLVWSGADPNATVSITLTAAGTQSHSITCRTRDTGTFTIPASMVQSVGLSALSFLNMFTMERRFSGTVSGIGLTSHDITATQTIIYQVARM